MFTIQMRLAGWGPDTPPEDIARVVTLLIEALATANMAQMRANAFPSLQTRAIRYDLEESQELFDDATLVLSRRSGDCDDLAAYRLAEVWLEGDHGARAYVRWQPDPTNEIPWGFHAMVQRGNGQIEDPSTALGMGWLVPLDGAHGGGVPYDGEEETE